MEMKHGASRVPSARSGRAMLEPHGTHEQLDSSTLIQSRVPLAAQRNNLHVSGGDRVDWGLSVKRAVNC